MNRPTRRSLDLSIRPCRMDEFDMIHNIIGEAAEAYRGTIPADCWHDPYMSANALQTEIDDGVMFAGCEIDGALAGVMGIQSVRNVALIRHAYVTPDFQGHGVGSALIRSLRSQTSCPILVGTWAAAIWAIGFYKRHGFTLVPTEMMAPLLRTYWTVSDRQIETSVVLSAESLDASQARRLMSEALHTSKAQSPTCRRAT